MHRNGHYALMVDLRDNGPHLLPGSNIPLKKSYLRIKAIDYVLTVIQVAFASVVHGSSPGLSLFAFQFRGTLLAAIVMIRAENSKATGSSWK